LCRRFSRHGDLPSCAAGPQRTRAGPPRSGPICTPSVKTVRASRLHVGTDPRQGPPKPMFLRMGNEYTLVPRLANLPTPAGSAAICITLPAHRGQVSRSAAKTPVGIAERACRSDPVNAGTDASENRIEFVLGLYERGTHTACISLSALVIDISVWMKFHLLDFNRSITAFDDCWQTHHSILISTGRLRFADLGAGWHCVR
jgi:hypothetical protein